MFEAGKPHNDLPRLPPDAKLETARILKKLVDVRGSLAALKEAGKLLPNQSIVLQSMILQEAKLSSEIENIVTTHDELYRQIDASEAEQSPAVKEVRQYKSALWEGFESLKRRERVDTSLILTVASKILERDVKFRTGSGTVVGNPRTRRILYTPPEGEDLIRDLLSNLLEFIRKEEETDPLVRVAAAHYQFEAIHPFIDGNGRTGRVLNILWMVQLGLLDLPVLYLSHEFLESRGEYYGLIQGVTQRGAWEEWIEYFLDCVDATALTTRRQFNLIHDSIQEAKSRVRLELPRWFPIDLVDLIFAKPYTRIGDVVEAGIAKRETASKHLRALEQIGLLSSSRKWKENLFLNLELLNILSLQGASFDTL